MSNQTDELEARLRRAAEEDPDHMEFHSYRIVEEFDRSGAGLTEVRTILRFMEANPDLDFGVPGPLVHFVERFAGAGYEGELFESLSRHPVGHTIWMLNRLINGTDDPAERARLISRLEQVASHPTANADVKERVDFYLEFQRSLETGS